MIDIKFRNYYTHFINQVIFIINYQHYFGNLKEFHFFIKFLNFLYLIIIIILHIIFCNLKQLIQLNLFH